MNILCTTYQTAYQSPGGGEIQLSRTMDSMREHGEQVDTFDPFETQIENYDLLHAFTSHPDNESTVSWATEHDVPTALSTIYWEPMEYIWQRSGLGKYIKIAEEIGKRTTRRLGITYLDTQKRLYEMADILLPNSNAEAELIASKFNISREKFEVVPNAVDQRFAEAEADEFVKEYGVEDFVLFVGVISPRKNLARMLRALSGLNKEIIIVGPAGDEEYARKCRTNAGDNTTFIGALDHDDPLLASAYAASEVFVLPSWYETPGLAALEAALAGSKVAITNRGSTQEYFLDYAEYLDPDDAHSIRDAVERAIVKDSSTDLRNRILQRYMWENTAQETIDAYKRIVD